ncbi:MAG TPA: hypothetical protein VKP69_09800, partial [Isosphaeraceae bacterium]|nr:hypothetical protein [Isosphaeraceae bacterium]
GLFAGLNVLPKVTYATDYSYKAERAMTERLVAALSAKIPLGDPPLSFIPTSNGFFLFEETTLGVPAG